MSRFAPLSIPNFESSEKMYVIDAVEQVWESIVGVYIEKLDEYLAALNVYACQSSTVALYLSMVEVGDAADFHCSSKGRAGGVCS